MEGMIMGSSLHRQEYPCNTLLSLWLFFQKFNVITVTHFMRSAYVTWLLRVKDAFQLANQLFQFGRILNGTLRVLKRKKPLTQ